MMAEKLKITFDCSKEQLGLAAEKVLGLRNTVISDADSAGGLIKALLQEAGNMPRFGRGHADPDGRYEVIEYVDCKTSEPDIVTVSLYEPIMDEYKVKFVEVVKRLQELILG